MDVQPETHAYFSLSTNGISIEIPVARSIVHDARRLAAEFTQNSIGYTCNIELLASFISYCSSRNAAVTLAIFDHFHDTFCHDAHINLVILQHELDEEQARRVLKGYYSVWNLTEPHGSRCIPQCIPALFTDPDVSLMAVFGGQGGMDNYMDEACWLLDVYAPLVADFVARMSAFLNRECQDPRLSHLYDFGLDPMQWCAPSSTQPPHAYFTHVSVAIPITGLIQLMHVMVLYKTLGLSPGELTDCFTAAVGHSQGTATATLLAAVTDEASFYSLSEKMLGILLLVGAMAEIERPLSHIDHELLCDAEKHEGSPTPMVSIRGIEGSKLQQLISEYNRRQADRWSHIYLSLANTHSQFVVSGMTTPLAKFVRWIRGNCAPLGDCQSRIPFSQRKLSARMSYLCINGPYHCELLQSVVSKQRAYAYEKGWTLHASDLRFEVRASNDGHDLRTEQDLTQHLFECTCVLPVDWPAAIGIPDETHIIDFSPGRFSAFGMFVQTNLEGRGIPVISASAIVAEVSSPLGSKAELFKQDIADVIESPNWQKQFAPRLVRTAHDGKLHIDTPMHRVLGMPPLMVAGMTPTTVNERFVGAISQAGYHVELAGGGIHTREALEAKVNNLMQVIRPGQGITLNGIYLNQRLWALHHSEMLRLRRAGYPIVGMCIGAGVPSLEVANEIIQSFRMAGLQHVAFKPGTADTIRKVIQIASHNPDFPVILQWTGGRAGGHHSCEDFHQPLLETYAAIRAQPNIVLVIGSGFGDANGTIPYLTGDWSLTHGRASMPVDGILIASRVMAALEAGTSLAGKQLLAQTTGLSDSEWEKTYKGASGGIITTPSEYGELMHVVATRSAVFCREMYDTVFSKPRDKQQQILDDKRKYIIARLNADHVRPWFGRKADGRVVDLEEMTYLEVAVRLAEFLFIQKSSRWIDPSYRVLFGDFIHHIEDRFSNSVCAYELQSFGEEFDPVNLVHRIAECYPALNTKLFTSSDADFFIALCQRRGQKPVPFIPVLDKNFATWLLKDTVGQSEDIDSVVDQDIQRTTILQGPVAARFVTKVNEPVKEILDGIYNGQVSALLHRFYGGNKWMVPVDDYIGSEPASFILPDSVQRHMLEDSCVYHLSDDESQLPSLETWIDTLTCPRKSWLHALLTAPAIMQGAKHTGNFVRSIMRPRPGQAVSVQMEDGMPKQVRVSRRNQATADVNISSDILGNISLTIYHLVNGSELPVEFKFVYCPDAPYALIREVMDGRDNRICLPLRMISCIGDQIGELSTPVVGMTDSSASYKKNGFIVTEDFVKRYCRTVDNRCAYYQPHDSRQMHAPMDALFVIATPGLFKFLTISPFNEGVLDMLHLGYQCSFADTFQTLRVGDSISYEVTMQELVNVIGGKRLVLRVQFYSMGTRIASLSTSFHYRNTTVDQSIAFRHVQEAPMELKIQTQADAAVLRNREWFVPSEGAEADIVPGTVLEFELSSHYRFKSETVYSYIQTTGRVMRRNPCVPGQKVVVGEVDFECYESLGNPVIAFLQRHGTGMDPVSLFDGPGIPVQKKMRVVAPRSAAPYAAASGDFNPIHTNPYMASYAGLPSTIIHGMWTAATTRALIEETVAQGIPDRMRAYSTEFVDMVFPGDTLDTKLYHIGMKGGRMLVSGETVNQRGSAVLTCTAEIEQPPTAMVFTGQGAQQVGMGMDLYAASEAARSVWDRADAHMIARYGVSLLHIVRKNPTEVTVKFSRCQKGALVHKSYMSLETELVNGDGSVSTVPLFPDINTRTRSFTHRAASGLLNATQFTQPAQTVFALACIADMRSKSLIPERAVFAGHSLGEFGALAAMTHIFSVEDIVDITFYRGMLLNKSVERDAQNRSQYGMAAVNPARVARAFNESELYFVVEAICRHGKRLLELVNLNVNGQQYVVTGHLSQLDVLRRVLDTISIRRISTSGHSWKEHVEALIRDTIVAHDGDITPRRGRATIPLSGIDVPSHSTQLLPAVACFRRCLQGRIRAGAVDYQQLRDIYIPNVTARAFEVSKDYFEHAHGITRSPVLAWELRDWNYPDVPEHSSVVSHLARTLLIELIAYQFASPVRWIATQDLLFGARGISRLIEVGPTPTLIGMAHKTLAAEKFTERDVTVLHIQQNNSDVYYLYEEEVVDDAEHSVEDTAPVATPVVAQAVSPQAISSSLAMQPTIEDQPIPTLAIIQMLVAQKLMKPLADVTGSKTIKELAGGKSTLQNEIVSELQKEFGKQVPDKAEEMPLGDLAASIGTFSGTLGKTPTTLIARMFAAKMPGGFTQSSARAYLKSVYGLGVQRQTALFLVAVTMEPPSRITQEAEAKQWIHTVAETYAKRANISLTAASAVSTSGAAGGNAVPVINSAEFDQVQREQREHNLRQIKVLAQHTGLDLRKYERMYEAAISDCATLQVQLDGVVSELGDDFVGGIQPMFDKNKARLYDSYWNWARLDIFELVSGLLRGECGLSTEQMHMLINRSNHRLVKHLRGVIAILEQKTDVMSLKARQTVADILSTIEASLGAPPVYKGVATITRPHTMITMAGDVIYEERPREDEPSYSEYVEHMYRLSTDHKPLLHIRSKTQGRSWRFDKSLTDLYFDSLHQICSSGLSLSGTTVLVTGCGQGSIGSEVLKGILASGAKVVATTSNYSRKSTLYFEDMYRKHGSRGSQLVVVPFNQGSVADIQGLVEFIYSEQGLSWDLDIIVPFASISEIGPDITSVGSKSELAHRVMLTNTIRLLGQVASIKAKLGLDLSPTQVVLPLSPNHGVFGGDGLYGESKAGLETLLNRWRSESWSAYLSIVGAVIGWTRGTNMMDSNDVLAEEVEKHSVRTFSSPVMAFNILGLLHRTISDIALELPLWADLSGGFEHFSENMSSMIGMRNTFAEQGKTRAALLSAAAQDHQEMSATRMGDVFTLETTEPLGNHSMAFPETKSYEQLAQLRHLEGTVNLDKVVVVTGYGEVNPFGNSETRWQMEAYGEFSLEGCIELAWIMGLIKHHSGPHTSTGDTYVGWVDSETNEPVKDMDVKAKYESRIVACTGIRVLEPSMTKGYDPNNIVMMREIQVDHDLEPFEASADEASHFKRGNGDKVDVWENPDGTWSVRFLKGAMISVPKALQFDRLVTAQLPTGWSAERYGIPKDIIDVVDPIVLYGLVATVEALLRSGITDPYELYKYFHVSEVGNSTGACFGGADAMKDIFGNGALDKDVKTDVVQEMFINTVAAWTNMLLLSSSGPIKATVGACGTTAMSLDVAVETIQSGKAKMMVAGAFDSYSGDAAYALGRVNATASSIDEAKRGRTPAEMSRPCTSSRNGFVESLGAGILTLMSATAAIEFGAPIYGVLGMTATSTDKEGRSVPAPGQGILTTAREIATPVPSPLLDFEYRREELAERHQEIDQWVERQHSKLQREIVRLKGSPQGLPCDEQVFVDSRTEFILHEAAKLRKDAQDKWSNEFWHRDPTIAPLRGSLATWGLTVDDIGLVSFHGTSTRANDRNEPHVINQQFSHLGRTPGHAVPAVCQKWLTGHPKGPAAAWMLSGALQSLRTGIIPGNRNADNIDEELEQYDYILYPNRSVQTPGIKAALLKSFGFGQVGGEILVLHPDYVLATISKGRLEEYQTKVKDREVQASLYWSNALTGKHTFVQVKDAPPYSEEQEPSVYLNSTARVQFDPKSKQYHF